MKIGYCCINLSLGKEACVSRGMIKRTFLEKGTTYAGELAFQNLNDTLKILKWNLSKNILLYRLSSEIFPWCSEYEMESLLNWPDIKNKLEEIGKYVMDNNLRVTMHPGPFNVLASENADVANKAIHELDHHAKIFDYMGLPLTPYYAINIHVYSGKPTLKDSASRFISSYHKLYKSTQKRLTIENDDKPNMFKVSDLYWLLYSQIKIPIVFDTFHHICNGDSTPYEEAFKMANSTWGDITQLIHHSSSRKKWEDETAKVTAHADYIYDKINTCGFDVDVEIEAKAKDLALLKYVNPNEGINANN